MKKIALLVMAFAVVFSSMSFAGSLTDKEKGLIDSNQTRLERSYNLRDMRPYEIGLKFGPPLGFGLEMSYNMNEMLAVVVGLGSDGGLNAVLGVDWFVLNTVIAPVVSAGVVYIGNFSFSAICLHAGIGADLQLDNAIGFNLGLDYTKSISNAAPATGTFQSFMYNNGVNIFFLNGGVTYRFK